MGRTDAEAGAPIIWPPDAKSRLTGKESDAGGDRRRMAATTKCSWLRLKLQVSSLRMYIYPGTLNSCGKSPRDRHLRMLRKVNPSKWQPLIAGEVEVDRCTLLCVKWITSGDRRTAQGTLFSVERQPGWERSLEENGCNPSTVHLKLSLCC